MKQFRDLNDLLSLTDKEVEKYFSNRFYPGDYAFSSSFNLVKIIHRNRDLCTSIFPFRDNSSTTTHRIENLIPITKESIKAAHSRSNSKEILLKKAFIWKLKQILGEDNVDVVNNHITLHFPELTVVNDVGMTHKIRGVYFSFYINVGCKSLTPLYLSGFRLDRNIFTYVELFKGYSFSHNSRLIGGDLCLGITDLTSSFPVNKTAEKLASIVSYLSSENTQGAYGGKQIHKLTNYTLEQVHVDSALSLQELLEYTVSYLVDFNVSSYLEVSDLLFSKPLKDIVEEAYEKGLINESQYNTLIVHNIGDISGRLITMDKKSLYDEWYNEYITKFKGEEKRLEIIDEPDVDKLPDDLTLGINYDFIPKLEYYIQDKFDNFYNQKIEEHAKQYYSI